MKLLQEYLNMPFPIYRNRLLFVLIPPTITMTLTLLQMVFQPYGLGRIEDVLIRVFGSTLICGSSMFVVAYIFPRIPFLKKFADLENWRLFNFVITWAVIVCITSSLSYVFYNLTTNHPPGVFYRTFKLILGVTIVISLIPTSIIAFIIRNDQLKWNLIEAKRLTKYIVAAGG